MYTLRYGGKKGKRISLALSDDLVVTRTQEARPLASAISTRAGVEAVNRSQLVVSFADAGVAVHWVMASKAVKDILKRCCDPIDRPNGDYDASGHSPKYGFGRLNPSREFFLVPLFSLAEEPAMSC